jgi:uracil-DNA glycosylase
VWGGRAKAKARLIDDRRHVPVPSANPSPLSQDGFLGKPFSRANDGLVERGGAPIDWSLTD